MSTPVLKAGTLAYIDSIGAGLVPCKVLSVTRDTSGVVPRDKVRFVVTANRMGYKRGFTDDMLSARIVVPRKAVYRVRGHIAPRIAPYEVEHDKS